jgi:alkylated DNA repair dioxygenase AlkB
MSVARAGNARAVPKPRGTRYGLAMPHAIEPDLFGAGVAPGGFRYRADFLSEPDERNLVAELERQDFKAFEFRGFEGKRRVVSYGWRYDFNGGGLKQAEDMPAFLSPLHERAAAFAGLARDDLQQVLLTEYAPGAAIGWHKDRSVFGKVIGISLLSDCVFRFRREARGTWQRAKLVVERRSAYLLAGAARHDWQHSIPPVDRLRYSITFREFRDASRLE